MTQIEPHGDEEWAEPRGVHDANDPMDLQYASPKPVHPLNRRLFHVLLGVAAVLLTLLLYYKPSRMSVYVSPNGWTALKTAVARGLEQFRADMGRYPDEGDGGLQALVACPRLNPERWAGPYVSADEVKDPWGKDIQYRYPGLHNPGSYDLWSCGCDGVSGTDDDFVNWLP